MDIRTFDLLPVPLCNEDVEAEGDPAPVRDLKEQIRAADALRSLAGAYIYNL